MLAATLVTLLKTVTRGPGPLHRVQPCHRHYSISKGTLTMGVDQTGRRGKGMEDPSHPVGEDAFGSGRRETGFGEGPASLRKLLVLGEQHTQSLQVWVLMTCQQPSDFGIHALFTAFSSHIWGWATTGKAQLDILPQILNGFFLTGGGFNRLS